MKKNRQLKKQPAVQEQKPAFPEWALWAVTAVWAVFVLKNYYSIFPVNSDYIAAMLSPGQYSGIFNLGNKLLAGHLLNIALCVLFLFSAFGAGRAASGIANIKWAGAAEEIAFSTGLGLGIIILAVFLLGVFSFLYAAPLIGLLILFAAAGAFYLKKYPPGRLFPGEKLGFLDKAALAALFLTAAVNLANALGPEIFYDSLVYHLGAPNFFKIAHRIAEMPDVLYSNLPLNHGMLFTAGLLIKDEMLSKLINYSAGILCCLAVIAVSIRYFGVKTGIWASLIFYTIAQVMISSWSCGTETSITLFAVLSLYGMILYRENGDIKLLIISGIFSGLAMGVKYTGIFIAAGVIFSHFAAVKKFSPKLLRDTVLWGAVASVVVMPWLIKNYAYKHDPVYPFMGGVFKISGDYDPQKVAGFIGETKQYNLKGPGEWIKHPWLVTMGKIPNSEYFTPLFLLLIPLLFFMGKPHAVIKTAVIFSLVAWITWSFSTTMIRFLMPAFPLLGLIIAWYLINCRYGFYKNIMLLLVLFVCLANISNASFIGYMQGGWRVASGAQSKEEFLSTTHSTYPYGYYAAADFVNKNLPLNSKLLILGECRSFYFERMPVVSSVFDNSPLVRMAKQSEDSRALYLKMKEQGITHIVLNLGEGARLNASYKILDMDERAAAVYAQFWNKYAAEIFHNDETRNNNWVNRVAVYRLLDEKEADAAHTPPEDLVTKFILKRKPA